MLDLLYIAVTYKILILAYSTGKYAVCIDAEDAENEKCPHHDEGKKKTNTGTQTNSAASTFAFVAFAICFVI